jgi:hypothetical protein
MANRMIIAPNGNSYSSFVIGAVRHFPGKGVLITDVRGKSLDWIKVTDPAKGKKVQELLSGVVNGEIRTRRLDWSFLTDAVTDAADMEEGGEDAQDSDVIEEVEA